MIRVIQNMNISQAGNMKLYASMTNGERTGRPSNKGSNELVNVEFTVKNKYVGSIELYLFNDTGEHGDDKDEWLIKYYPVHEDDDPVIIRQGNI